MLRAVKRPLGLLFVALLFDCTTTTTGTPDSRAPTPAPGEVCDVNNVTTLSTRFDPPRVVVAPGQTRPVTMTVDPDICAPITATFTSDNGGVATAPAPGALDLRHATYTFDVTGGALGTTKLTPAMPGAAPGSLASLEVEVRDGAAPKCAPAETAQKALDGNNLTAQGQGDRCRCSATGNPSV